MAKIYRLNRHYRNYKSANHQNVTRLAPPAPGTQEQKGGLWFLGLLVGLLIFIAAGNELAEQEGNGTLYNLAAGQNQSPNQLQLASPASPDKLDLSHAAAVANVEQANLAPSPLPSFCPDAPPSQLRVGIQAQVSAAKLPVHREAQIPADAFANVIETLMHNEQITLVAGPECAHAAYWWQVITPKGRYGWVREADNRGVLVVPR